MSCTRASAEEPNDREAGSGLWLDEAVASDLPIEPMMTIVRFARSPSMLQRRPIRTRHCHRLCLRLTRKACHPDDAERYVQSGRYDRCPFRLATSGIGLQYGRSEGGGFSEYLRGYPEARMVLLRRAMPAPTRSTGRCK